MTTRDRQVLRWGAMIAVLSWLVLRGLPAVIRSEARLRERVAERVAEDQRANSDVTALDSLEAAAARVQARVKAMGPQLLSGNSASEAAADIAARTRVLLEAQGARVDAVQGVADTSLGGGMRRSRVRVELTTDTPGLLTILHAIDRYPVLLTVTFIRIVSNEAARSDDAESLRIELGITGLYLMKREVP